MKSMELFKIFFCFDDMFDEKKFKPVTHLFDQGRKQNTSITSLLSLIIQHPNIFDVIVIFYSLPKTHPKKEIIRKRSEEIMQLINFFTSMKGLLARLTRSNLTYSEVSKFYRHNCLTC